jgi:hypothetical protein
MPSLTLGQQLVEPLKKDPLTALLTVLNIILLLEKILG